MGLTRYDGVLVSRSTTTFTILLGLAVTFIVLILDLFGVLAPWERATVDLRFMLAPRPSRPMTDEIVHVDIDDSALDMIGRWPWRRSTLADVVDELRLGGAKTIALDLVMSDAQAPDYLPGSDEPVDHDGRFAEAIGRARCVLPVTIHEGPLFHDVWMTPAGRAELDRLLSVLGRDIQESEEIAADEAGLTMPRRSRFMRRPLEFKKVAAWRKLGELAQATGGPWTFGDFERLVAPNRAEHVASYPERPILKSVWRQHKAWAAVSPHLQPTDCPGSYRDAAPLPLLAEQAGIVGYVNVEGQKDADGAVRRFDVWLPAPDGHAIQFGLAAAMLHRDLKPADVVPGRDELRIGDVVLPLHDGKLCIAWPTSNADPRWEGLLAGEARDGDITGHISIRVLVELARARRTHEVNRSRLAETTRFVLDYAEVECQRGQELSPRSLAAAADEVQFTLEEIPEDLEAEDLTDEDPAFRDHVHNCRMWVGITQVVQEGEEKIRLVESNLHEKVNGRLVFIGWTATAASADFVPTAIDARTPGVVVHATAAHMALTGECVWFMPRWSELAITLLMGLLAGIAAARFAPLPATAVAIGAMLVYVGIAGGWMFVSHALLMPMAAPVAAGVSAWIASTACQAAASQRERQRITRQFKARVSTQLVDYLVDNPQAVSVTGEEREVTVVFGDIAGFTSISEKLGGVATVSTLNQYLGRLADILVEHDAYVNKFLGDGLMAFWSAFAADEQQATKACRAALHCQSAIGQLNAQAREDNRPELGLRIGIATGRVIVGDCGAPPALNDYTVIGDPVNLASRLESANRYFGTRILIDNHTKSRLQDGPALRPIGRVAVVGRAVPVNVHEVLPPDAHTELIELSRRLTESLSAARADLASTVLDELQERFGPTPLLDFYRKVIADAGEDFDGVIRLGEK